MVFRRWFSGWREKWEQVYTLPAAREELIRSMLVIFSVLGVPAVIIGGLEALSQDHPETGLLYLGLYLPVLLTAVYSESISYRWKARILMGMLYILGVTNLVIYAFSGAGIHILISTSVLAALLQGRKGGLITIGMSMLAILTVGSLFSLEVIILDPQLRNLSDSSVTWLTALVIFLMLSSVVVVATSLVQSCLQRSLEELNRKQSQLESYSERLEDMVAERTQALERAQEEVLRREKLAAVGQLAGGVAHELRNPLGVISNAVYYLTTTAEIDSETLQEYLSILNQETRNATKIISDLLSFSRGPVIEPAEVPLDEFLPKAISRQPSQKGIQVEVAVPLDLPPLYVDPDHLGQIIGNLLRNACDALQEGGRIVLSAERTDWGQLPPEREDGFQAPEGGYLRLSVEDDGMGIEASDLEQIFEPLFTTKSRGIGLGLAVTRRLVQANSGWIEVSSRPGQGTKFMVFLPAADGD